MRKIRLKHAIIPVLAIILSILVFAGNSGQNERRDLLIKVIIFAINNGHFNPEDIDDDFSKKAFNLYLDRLDFSKKFLLEEDVEQLEKYETQLDEAFNNVDFEFLDKSIDIIEKRINEAQDYYSEILSSPFDFNISESVELDADKLDYAKNKEDLKERWRLSLKFETMTRLHDLLEEQEKAAGKSDTVKIKSFAEVEEEARGKIKTRYEDWYHRLSKIGDTDRLNIYVNSLVNVFDPHTQYFPPRDKENFDIRFSGQLEGIGAQLTQKNAYVEVVRIIPGSPSWKLGELEVGDFILKVRQEKGDAVDVVDMRLDDAVQLIRGHKGTTVHLTIKKMDGTTKEISIVRDVVILEETYAKSAVIENPDEKLKIGYIKLPSFYVDFGKMNGRRCSDDIKKEITKLKDENVNGIIFDLRDNGGGSLEDVVKIAGLFIEEGPVVQVQGNNGYQKVLKDFDRRIDFKDPLIVMVNQISASASEIFAAAMQDYDRALIVGSNSTYGKGTVQNFSELDKMLTRKPTGMDPLGSLKMTVQKFYRINGGATQIKGVTPDIVLPDYYSYMDYGEKDLDYALNWDKISKLSFNEWQPSFDFKYITEIAMERVGQDTTFGLIEENGQRLKGIRDDTEIQLNYEQYKTMIGQREKTGKKYRRIGKDTLDLNVNALPVDILEMESDTAKQARTEAWLTDLKKDVYLFETVNIMEDIHNYRKSNARKEK